MNKKRLKGKIVSDKMQKTVVVLVERIKEDPKYRKRHHVHKRYKAHDEKGECKIGDRVIIEECRPISKDKKWRVVEKITIQSEEDSEQSKDAPVSENKEQA